MLSSENRAKLMRMKAKQQNRARRNELRKDILNDVLGLFSKGKSKIEKEVETANLIPPNVQEGLNELEQEGKKVIEEVKKSGLTKRQITGLAIVGTAVIGALAFAFFSKKK